MLQAVRKGLSARAAVGLAEGRAVEPRRIAPESTLRQRVENNQPLTVDESERMMRLARIGSRHKQAPTHLKESEQSPLWIDPRFAR